LSPELDQDDMQPAERRGWLWTYLEERLGLDAMVQLGVKKRVPLHSSTLFYFLGGMALFLFVVQVVTGTLLSLYYKPSPDQAFESVQGIMTEVKFGWLIRSVHSWGANLLIGVLFLHVLTTYMMRAYRRPREFTWITGILLLGLFMALGFSGYLLPWNELSFFATRVGTALAGKVPLVGDKLLLVARGGENVTGDTLSRFYALHVAIFPLLALALLGLHLYLVQKHGMSVPQRWPCGIGWYLGLPALAAFGCVFPYCYTHAESVALWGYPAWKFFPLVYLMLAIFLYFAQGSRTVVAHRRAGLGHGEEEPPSMPFLPHFLLRDAVGWYLALAILAALAALFPWELGQKADPFGSAPEGIQPEWYFLFMFQALKQLPGHIHWEWLEGEVAGVGCFGFAGLVVFLVPFLDWGDRSRRMLNVLAASAVVFFIVMTAWGWFPDDPHLSVILGTSLFLGMLLLGVPLLERGQTARLALWILMALGILFLLGVIADFRWHLGMGRLFTERLVFWFGPRPGGL
jgi:quinol-cytochrome oxidoreductase complex cytochrome b subunit